MSRKKTAPTAAQLHAPAATDYRTVALEVLWNTARTWGSTSAVEGARLDAIDALVAMLLSGQVSSAQRDDLTSIAVKMLSDGTTSVQARVRLARLLVGGLA